MLMCCFGSVNNMLQQCDDCLPKNRRNTKSVCSVYDSIVCRCFGFAYAYNSNYAVQILLIVAFCGYLC